MNKLVSVGVGCMLAAAGVASAQGRCPGAGHDHGQGRGHAHGAAQLLERFDANHDGKIARDELLQGARSRFTATDTNHDGRLSADELTAARAHEQAERFTQRDKNGDGKLSADELPRMPAQVFARLDVNHDAALSSDELSKAPFAHAGRQRFAKLDGGSGAGVITQAEAEATASERFERMDKNGDGVIDANELAHAGRHGHARFHGQHGRDQEPAK